MRYPTTGYRQQPPTWYGTYLLDHVHEFRFRGVLSERSHDRAEFFGCDGACGYDWEKPNAECVRIVLKKQHQRVQHNTQWTSWLKISSVRSPPPPRLQRNETCRNMTRSRRRRGYHSTNNYRRRVEMNRIAANSSSAYIASPTAQFTAVTYHLHPCQRD